MAKPTSAFFSAGPSLVPSPVTATISRVGLSLLSMMPLTRVYLSWGEDRANTRKLGHTSSNFFWLTCTVKHVHMYKLCFKNLDGSRPFSIIHHIWKRLTITAIVTAKIFDLYFLVNEKDPKLQKSSSYTSSTTGRKNCFTICMSKWSEI